MSLIAAIYRQALHLFVDDTRLALFCLVLIALVAALTRFEVPGIWRGGLLLVGCVVILAESVFRGVRRR